MLPAADPGAGRAAPALPPGLSTLGHPTGAFAFGLRLMAIDSTLEDVPDTPANAAFFGRLNEKATASPYPQARCLYLAEVGTHALVDALFAPCRVSEHRLFKGLLRQLSAGMLVLLDRGLFSCANVAAVQAT